MIELTKKTIKTYLKDEKSYIDIIFVDDAGNKYFLPLEVKNMFECEASHLAEDIVTKGDYIMQKRLKNI